MILYFPRARPFGEPPFVPLTGSLSAESPPWLRHSAFVSSREFSVAWSALIRRIGMNRLQCSGGQGKSRKRVPWRGRSATVMATRVR